MRVLIAEDERILADFIADGLRQQAMAVDIVHDGLTAVDKLADDEYDVVVLDRDLPGKHGDDVCREAIAQGVHTRILMLTAMGDVRERVAGLRIGADDYLAKPFDFDELVARIDALARRARPVVPPVIKRAGIEMDTALRQVVHNGRHIPLSIKEFGVLHALLAADGAVVSAETLLTSVWDENADPFTSAVRIVMSRLRGKLDDPNVIETVAGAGYRIRRDSA
ncbi:response regulator transcription factor [Kibdelosporangium philippinense]|uniref:Response regulator transcription factor n=1 Tax=Kibdelosporangium philippinense TaxID=211113 RepID=A0ABS8ZV42_9PSEU|nr:response regulator transcription factor [Kibdelosporangium philippinense]MCE7010855.1 response regulator transcription factor [Kibdelosporangium philippinense]